MGSYLNLFIQPYQEGRYHFQCSRNHSLSLCARFKHITLAVCLHIPLINTIAFGILRVYMPPKTEIEELHLTWKDIDSLAKCHLGLRHTSTPEESEREAQDGFSSGCSLSISPQRSRLIDMDRRTWSEITVRDRDRFVKCFEKSIDNFIENSLMYDVNFRGYGTLIVSNKTKVVEVAALVNTCGFAIVDYGYNIPTDLDAWGKGLGRYRKQCMRGSSITPLPSVKIQDLGYSAKGFAQVISEFRQSEEVYARMIACYRNALIRTIQTHFKFS